MLKLVDQRDLAGVDLPPRLLRAEDRRLVDLRELHMPPRPAPRRAGARKELAPFDPAPRPCAVAWALGPTSTAPPGGRARSTSRPNSGPARTPRRRRASLTSRRRPPRRSSGPSSTTAPR